MYSCIVRKKESERVRELTNREYVLIGHSPLLD